MDHRQLAPVRVLIGAVTQFGGQGNRAIATHLRSAIHRSCDGVGFALTVGAYHGDDRGVAVVHVGRLRDRPVGPYLRLLPRWASSERVAVVSAVGADHRHRRLAGIAVGVRGQHDGPVVANLHLALLVAVDGVLVQGAVGSNHRNRVGGEGREAGKRRHPSECGPPATGGGLRHRAICAHDDGAGECLAGAERAVGVLHRHDGLSELVLRDDDRGAVGPPHHGGRFGTDDLRTGLGGSDDHVGRLDGHVHGRRVGMGRTRVEQARETVQVKSARGVARRHHEGVRAGVARVGGVGDGAVRHGDRAVLWPADGAAFRCGVGHRITVGVDAGLLRNCDRSARFHAQTRCFTAELRRPIEEGVFDLAAYQLQQRHDAGHRHSRWAVVTYRRGRDAQRRENGRHRRMNRPNPWIRLRRHRSDDRGAESLGCPLDARGGFVGMERRARVVLCCQRPRKGSVDGSPARTRLPRSERANVQFGKACRLMRLACGRSSSDQPVPRGAESPFVIASVLDLCHVLVLGGTIPRANSRVVSIATERAELTESRAHGGPRDSWFGSIVRGRSWPKVRQR